MTVLYECGRCHQQSARDNVVAQLYVPMMPLQRMDGSSPLPNMAGERDLCADCLDSLSRWLEAGAE
ncbi:hypothetical protein LCGC14_2751920 [marine sediment metagenome]|uniref:Uncharacterized protein n=1 Tax=marine sediment metagenome TaxID=412755 RepID=A0A0F8ZNI9_9ZZZZ